MIARLHLSTFALAAGLAASVPVFSQTIDPSTVTTPAVVTASTAPAPGLTSVPPLSPAVQELMSFKSADAKFDISDLMDVLRDRRHEGWVLAAYPDPKTSQPLIGAGFSLDLPARPHPQRDPLNPHPFLEPSSAELWQAAGLEPARLQRMLGTFHQQLDTWGKRGFRRQIRSLDPQITDDEANALLRVGAIQAIYNAKAYCRNFDQLTASQQMGLSQLVYQMGVNLEQFQSFLGLINRDGSNAEAWTTDAAYWKTVQQSLIHSQWARLYRTRATAVIAMLNPHYELDPARAEHGVGTMLRPAVVRGHHHHATATLRNASYHKHSGASARRHKARLRKD